MSKHDLSTMKTINVSETTPAQIDYLIAMSEGYKLVSDGISILLERGKEIRILGPNGSSLAYSPSTNPSHGQPILERERIGVVPQDAGWLATMDLDEGDAMVQVNAGPTMLMAGLRCHVAAEYGENVEVPEAIGRHAHMYGQQHDSPDDSPSAASSRSPRPRLR
jgi:hypothetical protein